MKLKRAVLLFVLVVAGGVVAVGAGLASGSRSDALGAGTASDNRARATVAAARLLALVQLPAGTARSATDPAEDQLGLSQPTYEEATPNLVDAGAWWTNPASPRAVLAYVAAHLPAAAKQSEHSSGGGLPGTVQTASETFALAPIRGVLSERLLGVTTVALARGVTGSAPTAKRSG